ncbi:MAG: MOSC domain-containing protein [Deltaproteobacteria bacterium]|nr:MOSC domain-containing protein [Deltaproteobacteria bacterium]
MPAGRIAEIWRHPVKSMEGERIERALLGENGIPGDRAWAVRDEERGGIRGAKKIPRLMTCRARYASEPAVGAPAPAPEITLPGGAVVRASDANAAERISAALEQRVTLWPLLPASALEHYKRGAPDSPDVLTEMRAIFGRNADEPLPNFAQFPPELVQYESPPGTYFDAYPLLVVTEATLRKLRAIAPRSVIDVRRFRPNLVIATEDEGFVEAAWTGKQLRIGGATLDVLGPCPRCVMITHGFGDVPQDTGLMRTVVKEADQNVGAYAKIASAGEVRVGDAVTLV